MLVSICTPSHNTKYLKELYSSILAQTHDNRERNILLNWPAIWDVLDYIDDVRVNIRHTELLTGIGALKHEVFTKANGEILVEVDHDDIITPDCLEKIHAAFMGDEEVGFVYSDNAKLAESFIPYDTKHWWTYRSFNRGGEKLCAMESLPITPANMWYIWFMPDHVRAWRSDVYHAVWWHDITLEILDDQDLIQRTFMETKFHHIPEVLYIYRITWENTWTERNKEIQEWTVRMYDKNIYDIAYRWADINGLEKIDLCWGINKQEWWTSLDLIWWDICADLDKKWPLKDWSVWVIRAHDALEHLVDKQHTMSEIHRVLAPGGILLSSTPSTDGRWARQDPTHVSFWNENAFRYWIASREQPRFIRNTDKLFREIRLYTYECADKISYVVAHLEKK